MPQSGSSVEPPRAHQVTPGRLVRTKEGIYQSPYPTPNIPSKSVWDLIMQPIAFDDPAFFMKECNKRGTKINYGQFKQTTVRLAIGMEKALGLKPGDTVMLSAMNSINWIIVLFACQFLGLKVSLANPMYLKSELAHVVSLTAPKYFFVQARNLNRYSSIGLPWSRIVLIDQDLNGYLGLGSISSMLKSVSWEKDGCATRKAHQPANLDDATYFCMSSGTTGLPKAVEITHNNVAAMLYMLNNVPGGFLNLPIKNVSFLPFFHAFALLTSVMITPLNHGQLFIISPFNAATYVKVIQEEKADVSCVVPPVVAALSTAPGLTSEMFKSLRFSPCGGAALDAESQVRAWKRLGLPITQGWGMSETTVGMLGLNQCAQAGSCGWLLPGGEARLVDENMQDVPLGERGELLVRGRNVMKGYYRNEKATKETFHEPGHWLRTGDIAVVDDRGEFRIVDRMKELIKTKGYQVAPAELEGLLKTHPKVKLAAVIGVYDKKAMTEYPRAYVELAPDVKVLPSEHPALTKELDEFIRKQVSTHKYLRGGIKIIDAVPASATGKILRKEVRLMRKQEEQEEEQAKATRSSKL